MALKNYQVLAKDPRDTALPNDGVTQVGRPKSAEEWKVLRYELSNFVCEGQYEEGVARILRTYLSNLDQPTQPAVWLSGFYGSGKSHVARVLEYIWQDVTLPDGTSARSIVHLTSDIEDLLTELTTVGRRGAGLWAASGELGAGAAGSVRLAILGILFGAAGLPEDYAKGRFVLWLKQEAMYDDVVTSLEDGGHQLDSELMHMYVSTPLADAVLHAKPNFAESNSAARQHFRASFTRVADINNEDFLVIMEQVIHFASGATDELPHTVIVLDELQQYLTANPGQTGEFQSVVKAISSRFSSRILLLATGQSALLAHPEMAKLKDRFTVPIGLTDSDVERVLRHVALRKDPQHRPEIEQVLSKCSGEIDRQLQGTKLEARHADKEILVSDYPLLPTRRRFWENVLRAVDRAGAAGQLRTQLRTAYEATKYVADRDLGVVVPGDFIYQQQSKAMVESGVLLRDISERIDRLNDGTEAGRLRFRACSLVFLIQQLIADAGSDIGLRPSAGAIADLMIEDLRSDGPKIREVLPNVLSQLTDEGVLMRIEKDGEPEYRLQTRESMEWEGEFRTSRTKYANDAATIADFRDKQLRERVSQEIGSVQIKQGAMNEPRHVIAHFSSEAPKVDSDIPVWVRSEHQVRSENTVKQDAQTAGTESATVFTFLPKMSSNELRDAIAGYLAASEVLSRRAPGRQASPEAAQARLGMEARRDQFERDFEAIVSRIIDGSKVYLGGGTEVTASDSSLRAYVTEAARKAVHRLYRRFDVADHRKWPLVVDRAREGNTDALSVLGYTGKPEDHPVCDEILKFMGTGRKGSDIRRNFEGPPFGWPRDAINGALMVLVANGLAVARMHGEPQTVKQLDANKITQLDFKAESVVIGANEKIAIRGVFSNAGVSAASGEELQSASIWMRRMLALAEEAGGEPPAPKPEGTELLSQIERTSGNEQLQAIYEHRNELKQLTERWKQNAAKLAQRMPKWRTLVDLLGHSADSEGVQELRQRIDAIRDQRLLLEDPDPVQPLLDEVSRMLREALSTAYDEFFVEYDRQMSGLEEHEAWQKLSDDKATEVLQVAGLRRLEKPNMQSPEALANALRQRPLSELGAQADALSTRFERALTHAMEETGPRVRRVTVPKRVFHEEPEIEEFIAELKEELLRHVKDGHPVAVS